MSNKKQTTSPAMQLIVLVKNHKMSHCPWSRERATHIDNWAWELAVRGGFYFHKTDFGDPTGYIDEGLYAAAIEEENMSAIRAMEYAAKRPPFIAREVHTTSNGNRMAHMAGTRKECRLSVGARFHWDGQWVKVTSFAKDNSYVTACSYPANSYGNLPKCEVCGQTRCDQYDRKAEKPDRIYKITVEELRAGRALERKRHPKCKLCLKPSAEGKEICGDDHHCTEWRCKKIIASAQEGRRVPSEWRKGERVLLCNACVEKREADKSAEVSHA